jgi:YARHG domain
MKAILCAGIAAIAAATSVTAPANAGDVQGDAYDCRELWSLRNQIYKANGYCFKTSKAISRFGNAGCSFDSLAEVPLSDQDRSVIRDVKKSEARQRC